MITITVGKKRTASFVPFDQFNNPNPVGPDGVPLDVIGIPTWNLLPLETTIVRDAAELTGITLVPAADGRTCDVIADVENVTLGVEVHADRGDGVMVRGAQLVETVGVAGPTIVIASLGIQFSEEKDV